jgi:hypothetical protein
MKILLDENLDCRLKGTLSEHEVESVSSKGWSGLDNAALLSKAEGKFDVFITFDSNMTYQNISKFKIPIMSLKASSNRLADTKPLMSKVIDILPSIQTWKVMVIS